MGWWLGSPVQRSDRSSRWHNHVAAFRWSDGFILYRSLLVSLLCHWLVGRADGHGFKKIVLIARGHFLCLWK